MTTKLCHLKADCAGYAGTATYVGNVPFEKCCEGPGYASKFCAPAAITILNPQVVCDP